MESLFVFYKSHFVVLFTLEAFSKLKIPNSENDKSLEVFYSWGKAFTVKNRQIKNSVVHSELPSTRKQFK